MRFNAGDVNCQRHALSAPSPVSLSPCLLVSLSSLVGPLKFFRIVDPSVIMQA